MSRGQHFSSQASDTPTSGYAWSQCKKCFKQHEIFRSDERTFAYSYCEKLFNVQGVLTAHEKLDSKHWS